MENGQESNIIVIRLNDGEDLHKSLEETALKRDVESGMVLMGIGMLRDFTLGYFDGSGYQKSRTGEAHELVSLQGSLAKCDGEIIVHLHGSLGADDYSLKGGHIFSGTVNGLAEITLLKLDGVKLYRELNEKTGLKELHIK